MNFTYDRSDPQAEYYETLSGLMDRWEYELVEFKEAKGQYSEDKIGQYFSAISNEANLKNQQYGWFVLGVSEQNEKYPVGTSFKKGNPSLLEKFKYQISKDTTDGMTFLDIIELYPEYEGERKRILMFKIPAAVAGIPTEWKNHYYARNGESLVALQQYKIDQIRNQQRRDWSRLFVPGAGIQHLSKEAIQIARLKYKEKMNRPHITEEVDQLTDEEFLTKLKLMQGGKVTNACMLLLGNPDYDTLFSYTPSIMWRLISQDGTIKDYEIFGIPFLTVTDKVFKRIRNLTYRYMTDRGSLFPIETQQYDTWLLRELMNNCIAHSNYLLGGRIYINEEEDSIYITNPGDFLPHKVETVLQKTYNPPFYRNQLLADSMVNVHMIDTATSGIKRIYRIQRERFFPMPDYDLSTSNQVGVTVYGKILNQQYTYMLHDHPELDIETVFLLDQVQKGHAERLSKDAIKHLRKNRLVEGRVSNLYLASDIAHSIDEEAKYIKNKAFNDQYYKDLIVEYLRKYGKASKQDIRELLWEKLPDILDDKQKNSKISNLLTAMRKKGIIAPDSSNQQKSRWILVGDRENQSRE